MSSTNKTTNYELSQFIGADKPTFLGDYNSDMLKIDNQMKTNANNAQSANTLAQTAKTTADSAEEHAQTGITNAGSAQTTANSALSKATANEALINALMAKFDLSNIETISANEMSSNNGAVNSGSVTIAKNSDGSLAKVYGSIFTSGSSAGAVKITFPSSLRPQTEFSIVNLGVQFYDLSQETIGCSATFKTNGNIEINGFASGGTGMKRIVLLPMLLFITDFGDVPSVNP